MCCVMCVFEFVLIVSDITRAVRLCCVYGIHHPLIVSDRILIVCCNRCCVCDCGCELPSLC